MAHEEHTPSSSGGGRLSKKLKNKKVPQRGMGVAQLEKIISDEQQKNDVAILTPNSTNFRPPPSIPLPPPLPPNLHRHLIPIIDAPNPIFASKPPHTITNGGNPWGRLWSGADYQYERENPNPNPNPNQNHAMNLSDLQYKSRRSHLLQQPCSSSMMELPSNQSYCSNNYPPLMRHEEKMIGMKRPYPFSMENISIPSFNFKFPFSPISRSNESASSSNGLELPNSAFREKSLVAKDFLTLALPGQTKDPSGSDWSNRQPLYSFFPAAKNPGNNNGEEGEQVDLSLKL